MPNESINLRCGNGSQAAASLVYLADQNSAGPLYYLQAVRSYTGSLESKLDEMRVPYENMEKFWTGKLASHVPGPCDALMSPPSSHPYAARYCAAVAAQFPESVDISARFHRVGNVTAGAPDSTAADVYAALSYDRHGDEPSWNAVVIVDDVFASGKTAAALIQHLREAGLRPEASITIACPLRIKKP